MTTDSKVVNSHPYFQKAQFNDVSEQDDMMTRRGTGFLTRIGREKGGREQGRRGRAQNCMGRGERFEKESPTSPSQPLRPSRQPTSVGLPVADLRLHSICAICRRYPGFNGCTNVARSRGGSSGGGGGGRWRWRWRWRPLLSKFKLSLGSGWSGEAWGRRGTCCMIRD